MVGAKRSIGLRGVLETFAPAQTRPGTLRSGTGAVRTPKSGLVRDRERPMNGASGCINLQCLSRSLHFPCRTLLKGQLFSPWFPTQMCEST